MTPVDFQQSLLKTLMEGEFRLVVESNVVFIQY